MATTGDTSRSYKNRIQYLHRKPSPTDALLHHCDMNNISLPALAVMMRTMGREDAAVTIECYVSETVFNT